jgi:hypothetical protein
MSRYSKQGGGAVTHVVVRNARHNSNRRKLPTQDGRSLRQFCSRWKVERPFAWFHNCRRFVTRREYKASNFLGMLQLACVLILLRRVLRWIQLILVICWTPYWLVHSYSGIVYSDEVSILLASLTLDPNYLSGDFSFFHVKGPLTQSSVTFEIYQRNV